MVLTPLSALGLLKVLPPSSIITPPDEGCQPYTGRYFLTPGNPAVRVLPAQIRPLKPTYASLESTRPNPGAKDRKAPLRIDHSINNTWRE